MVAAENDALPKGKVGGIGDVIRDIPKYLSLANQQVSVITPGYGYQSTFDYSEKLYEFYVSFQGKVETVSLFKLHINGESNVSQFVLEHELFTNAGIGEIYCDDGSNRPFASDASKFAFFSTAVCELLITHWKDHFNVIHLHDWHTAFIAIHRALNYKYEELKKLRCVYTVHNLALQGTRPFRDDESSFYTWFPDLRINEEQICDPGYRHCINPARAGINLSDTVHVVSPTYANEVVRASEPHIGFIGGEGLENDLRHAANENRLFGILNGCQYDIDLPKVLKKTSFIHLIKSKLLKWVAKDKYALSTHIIALERLNLWLADKSTGPLITSVGRLTLQKVALLIANDEGQSALVSLLNIIKSYKGKLIILGSGDPELEKLMTLIMVEHDNFIFLNGYDDALSQSLYQQGDLFLMPSSFEPCGISQMLSMRAGQACLVHEIGGLKDTVAHNETGFCFSGINIYEQISSMKIELSNALDIFQNNTKKWETIAKQAKAERFTWESSIEQYIDKLY